MSGALDLCRSKDKRGCAYISLYRCGVESLCFDGVCHGFRASSSGASVRFGEGYEVDLRPRRLRRGSHVLKLEGIPFEILLLLLEQRDEIVTRDQIVSRVSGQASSWIPTTVSGVRSASFARS